MKALNNVMIGLAIAPLVAFSSQSVFAFSIIPPNAPLNTPEYTIGEQKWVTTLNPFPATGLSKGGTEELLSLLNTQFQPNSWAFNTAVNDLEGSFQIGRYEAIGTATQVGAIFTLNYLPRGADPITGDQTVLHWIQRVSNNNNVTDNPGYGNLENIIDVLAPVATQTRPNVPYYDVLPSGDPSLDITPFAVPPRFEDFTFRKNSEQSTTWSAELYLVSINTNKPTEVTIYNGVSWGWENKPVPEPLTILGSATALGLGAFFKKRLSKNPKQVKT